MLTGERIKITGKINKTGEIVFVSKYIVVDNKITEKSEKPKKEKKYNFLDVERLEAELKRINTSRSTTGIEMVEKMLKEVREDVNRGKN